MNTGNRGSIPGRVIPKTLKMVLENPCLTLSNVSYESSLMWSNSWKGVVAMEKVAICSPSTTVANFFTLQVRRIRGGWLFCFTAYQHFSGHLSPYLVISKSFKQFSLV